jgi:HSP90 family molecular chaperone
MKLHQMRYIREVARQGLNVSVAAGCLHTSQPGVSKQIQLLEEELGLLIFHRSGKRLTGVTEPGRIILDFAERMLREVDNISRVSEDFTRVSAGTLSIATTHTQARYRLPLAVKAFIERYPDVQLNIHQGNPSQVAELVLYGTSAAAAEGESPDPIPGEGGKAYTTLAGYRSRLEDANAKRILYCTDEAGQAGALALWKSQGAEVLLADTFIDTQFIPWLEYRHEDLKFQRVDSELDESLQEKEGELADADGKDNSEKLRDLFKAALANEKVTIQVQALKGDNAPAALILLPEQMRRLNDMGALMEQRLPGLPDHHVLLVNRKHALVAGLLKLSAGAVITGAGGGSSPSQQLADDLGRHLYEMARLAVGGLEPNQLAGFQQRSADLMGRLMQRGL